MVSICLKSTFFDYTFEVILIFEKSLIFLAKCQTLR